MDTAAAACTNCGATLPPGARCCPRCGQRTRCGPRSLREAVQAVVGRDGSPDGRLSPTLRRLFVPGALKADWSAGRQQRCLGPMRLLLLALAHAGPQRRVSEHAVFALHLAVFTMLAVLLLAPLELLGDAIPAGEGIGLATALWFTLALRRYHGGAWWAVGLRALFVLALLLLPLPYLDALVAPSTLS